MGEKEFEDQYIEKTDKKYVDKLGMTKVGFIQGFKRFLGIGPKRPIYEIYYQKGMPHSESVLNGSARGGLKSPVFRPGDYDADNPIQARRMAYGDAKNHEKFYKALVNEGVYPPGTKVKVRKVKHTNAYSINLFMPKIDMTPFGSYSKKDRKKLREENIHQRIIDIAEKEFGYKGELYIPYRDYPNSELETEKTHFDEDISHGWNYGVAGGKLRYIDTEIFGQGGKLPFKGRKSLDERNKLNQKRTEEYEAYQQRLEEKQKPSNLERTVATISLIIFIASFFFFSSNLTGNVISNLNQSTSNIIGGTLFLIGLVGAFMYFRKKK